MKKYKSPGRKLIDNDGTPPSFTINPNAPIVLSRVIKHKIKSSMFEFDIFDITNILGLQETEIPVLVIIRDKGESYISLPYHAKEAVLAFVPQQKPQYQRMPNGDIAEVYCTRGYYIETVEQCNSYYRSKDN